MGTVATEAVAAPDNPSAAVSTPATNSVLRQLNNLAGTPRAMSTPRMASKRPKTPLSGSVTGAASPLDAGAAGLQFELTRLRNEVRAKQRELEGVEAEVAAGRAALATKDRALTKASIEADALKDRALRAEAEVAKRTKELRDMEAANQKLRSTADSAERQADKLTQKLANMPQGPGFSAEVAAMQSEVKALKAANASLSEDNKAAANLIRAKDRELDAAAAKVAHADAVLVQCKEMQNKILDQKRLLDEAAASAATLQLVQRQKDADIARMTAALDQANASQAATAHSLAAVNTKLQASEAARTELSCEVSLLRDELARTSAVAARVASSEVRNGAKDTGVVPVTMHLEEVRYLNGELDRLREKLKAAEKAAHASHLQKEKLQGRLEAVIAGKTEVRPLTPRLDLPTWGSPAARTSSGALCSPATQALASPAAPAPVPKSSPRGYAHVQSSGYGRLSPRGSLTGRASPVSGTQALASVSSLSQRTSSGGTLDATMGASPTAAQLSTAADRVPALDLKPAKQPALVATSPPATKIPSVKPGAGEKPSPGPSAAKEPAAGMPADSAAQDTATPAAMLMVATSETGIASGIPAPPAAAAAVAVGMTSMVPAQATAMSTLTTKMASQPGTQVAGAKEAPANDAERSPAAAAVQQPVAVETGAFEMTQHQLAPVATHLLDTAVDAAAPGEASATDVSEADSHADLAGSISHPDLAPAAQEQRAKDLSAHDESKLNDKEHANVKHAGLVIKVGEPALEVGAGATPARRESIELDSSAVSRASSAALPQGVGVSVYSIVI